MTPKLHDLPCPWCGEAVVGKGGIWFAEPPEADDAIHCGICLRLAIFQADLTLRKATAGEAFELLMQLEQGGRSDG